MKKRKKRITDVKNKNGICFQYYTECSSTYGKGTVLESASSIFGQAKSVLKESGKKVVDFLRDGISMKQVLTRVLNPANPDRILYKNSFFIKFLEWDIIENVVFEDYGEYDRNTKVITSGVSIVEEDDSFYIYKNDYISEREKDASKVKKNDLQEVIVVDPTPGVSPSVTPDVSSFVTTIDNNKIIDTSVYDENNFSCKISLFSFVLVIC